MQSALYANDDAVRRLTEQVIAAGHAIFQIHKLAASDGDHVARLLDLFRPPQDAMVLDAGCGVGEVARLMHAQRSDLKFTLLNISAAQLAMCPPRFDAIAADFHKVPRPSHTFDAVMFNYSLGHGDVIGAIEEASRLLKRRGVLFIYDLTGRDGARLQEALGYTLHRADTVCRAALDAGLRLDLLHYPSETSVADFIEHIGAEEYAEIFKGIDPVAYRFVKC